MTTITNHSEYTVAVNEAKLHDYRYFTLNAPTITDEQYDRLYFAIQDYETAHPDETLADSPTQTCYSENGNGKRQVARRTACLSMKKIHDAKTMVKYLRTQQKACNLSDAVIDVEWKFDGDTVALVYLNGRLAEATYGHGKELMASDCMDHIKHVQGVPQIVTAWHDLDRVEVRGEVIINNANFEAYTGKKKAHRTTCSSFMNKKVAVAQECRLLEFHPFRGTLSPTLSRKGEGVNSHSHVMEELADYGFLTCGHVAQFTLTADLDTMEQIIEDIVCEAENMRDTLPFPTDGLVFKFDNYEVYDMIGTTDHDAKYNAAFKFRPVHKAVTTYRGYHTTIGEKTGKVTYIADYDMVVLNGIECSNANCGSEQTFKAKNLKPGDRIQVSLHGDVIPHIDGSPTPSLPEGEGAVNTPAVEEPIVIAAENNQSEPATETSESRTIEEECPSVSLTEEDVDDSEPIPYTAPAITPVTPAEPLCSGYPPRPEHLRRKYRMVGEPRIHRHPDGTASVAVAQEPESATWQKIAGAIVATIAIIGIAVLLFSTIGIAVFLLPLLAGAFK